MKNLILFITIFNFIFGNLAHATQLKLIEGDITVGHTSEREYIGRNSHFEYNIGDWVAYNDAAGVSPVDGTGGSPSVTCTRTTSSPLSGNGSMLITKGASNRQGDGCSVNFTIDPADQGRVLRINFDYAISSGTYTDDALQVYVYDVTNGVVIQPAPNKVKNSTITSYIQPFEFQTAINSTSYRLILHVAGTDSNAWNMKLDSIKVSRSFVPTGPPMTDMTSVTLTPSAGFGTTSLQTTTVKRLGDRAVFRSYFKSGTVAASTASIALPAGYVIDGTKMTSQTNAQQVGAWWYLHTGTSNPAGPYPIFYDGSDTANVYLAAASASNQFTKFNGSSIFANSDSFSFEFELPIAGFSSNTSMSSNESTAVVAAYGLTQNPTGTLSGAFNPVIFGTVTKDATGSYNISNGQYVCPVTGFYAASVNLGLTHASAAVGNAFGVAIYDSFSGTANFKNFVTAANTSVLNYNPETSGVVYCPAGSYIQFQSWDNGTTPTYSSTLGGSSFSIQRIAGPSQVAASESVSMQVNQASPTATVVSGESLLKFTSSPTRDTHVSFSTSSGGYTLPSPGAYHFTACVDIAATYSAGQYAAIGIGKNSTSSSTYKNTQKAGGSNGDIYPCVTGTIVGVTGDVLYPLVQSNATSPTIGSNSTQNYFMVERVGN